METPRLEIDLKKIYHNTKSIVNLFKAKNIDVMGITKAVMGDPEIAKVMINAGVSCIGDSRIENIERMKQAGVTAKLALIRTPLISKAEKVVLHADISLNSEVDVIRELSKYALKHSRTHKIILMIEMGDLREGIEIEEIDQFICEVKALPKIKIVGLGTNLGCLNDVKPNSRKMAELSSIASRLEKTHGIEFVIISGGNSSNFQWIMNAHDVYRINNLRIGELILLGTNPSSGSPVHFLKQNAFTLVTEVIESKKKKPYLEGVNTINSSGEAQEIGDELGYGSRTILGIGEQDTNVQGLRPLGNFTIVGSTSDHMIICNASNNLRVGQEARFTMSYEALTSAYTSPFVEKRIIS